MNKIKGKKKLVQSLKFQEKSDDKIKQIDLEIKNNDKLF